MAVVDLVRDTVQQFLTEHSAGQLDVAGVDPQIHAQLHSSVEKQLALWKKSRQCIVTGCDDLAIQRSHAIQEAGPLEHIAENKFVLSPGVQLGGHARTMRKITTATASTFPGFCSTHEQMFHGFERRRRLGERSDFILQSYRATCREVVRLRQEYSYMKSNLQSVRDVSTRFLASEIAKRIRARGIEIALDAVYEVLKLPSDLDDVSPFLEGARNDLEKLESSHLKCMEQALFGTAPIDPPVKTVALPAEIPVCLSGLDCLRFRSGEHHRRALVILNVIPERAVTYLIVFVSPEDRDCLDPYLDKIDSLLAGVNTIEAAMLHVTDHWFLRPSAWNRLPKRRQNAILAALQHSDASAINWTSLSIFDEVRANVLDELEAAKPELARTVDECKIISFERWKLEVD